MRRAIRSGIPWVSVLLMALCLQQVVVPRAVAANLSPEAVAALQNPHAEIGEAVRQELEDAWRELAEATLGQVLQGADVAAKLWVDRVDDSPYLHFYAAGQAQDPTRKLVLEVFHGAGEQGIERAYGRWFRPTQVGDLSIEPLEFAGDRSVFSTLTDDGTEAIYWQTGEVYVEARQSEGVKPLAEAMHAAAEKQRVYDFPASLTQPEAEPTPPPVVVAGGVSEVLCVEGDVCRERVTGLPFRVLPRPFSNVYQGKEAIPDKIVESNIRAFYPLYVFAREDLDLSDPVEPKGWYRVGGSVKAQPLGWMQAKDVLEWRQALVVAYTHHGTGEEARQKVLMFRDLDDLKQLVASPERDRDAVNLYDRIDQGDIPESVVSKEPERFVDITQTFYLLPIVDFETVDIEGDEARYLQVAAAVPGKRGADPLSDPGYRKQSQEKPQLRGEPAKALGMDIVFVMDMTRSMGPYIERTKEAITSLVQRLGREEVAAKIRFGLVGYRDDVSKMPALLFTRQNFTPELVDAQAFIEILDKQAKATRIGSRDYAEEVFAGVELGLDSAWNENALRFIVLVGDASSHPVGHEQNTTGKDANVLKLAANDAQIHILGFHLLDPRMSEDHPIAREQFTVLSKVRGSEESALVSVDIDKPDQFEAAVEQLADVWVSKISEAQGIAPTERSAEPAPGPAKKAKHEMDRLVAAALVEYLGKEANPPKDIIAWALDRDLTNPAVRTLDVRVLVNKEQLSDLIQALDQVIGALKEATKTQSQFFEALQAVAGQTMKNPEGIGDAERLADAGLVPAFIQTLPYKSEILSLNDEKFAEMTAEDRFKLERRLEAKLAQYRDINEQVDGWVALNEADPETKKVYPLHLDYLP